LPCLKGFLYAACSDIAAWIVIMNFSGLLAELDNAVAHGSAAQRGEILRRITDVFVAGAESYSTNQIDLFDAVFVRIAAMIELSARAALANRLAKAPRAPSIISRILASDDEIDVARPVLERSSLDNETLLTAARTKSQLHLLAISRRSSLDEAVTDVLVERGDKPVVLSTATNPAARFSDNGYKTLVRRSDGDDDLATCVALRPDIPRQHLMRLLVRASHAVQVKLVAANPSMAIAIEAAVAEAATVILDKTSTLSRDYDAARLRIGSLHSAGQLGETEVAGFAAANQFEETTVALAVLCDLPVEEADRAMVDDRPDAIVLLAKAAGLSWPAAKAILRMRAGARGISPGELDQCHETFSRLKPATAQQVVGFQSRRSRITRLGRSAA
jgi:uncharacterized protein (DUF2336 family)